MMGIDVIVIGAGVAGISAAAELSEHCKVLLLERELQPGYHSSGRSAAYFAPAYGNEVVQVMTRESASDYQYPADFFDDVLLLPRASLFVAEAERMDAIAAMQESHPWLCRLEGQALRDLVPPLNVAFSVGLLDPEGGDLNVHAILQGYQRKFRANGGRIRFDANVVAIKPSSAGWEVRLEQDESIQTSKIVNAAGAWADQIAFAANLKGLGLQPKRRTACLVKPKPEWGIQSWPMVIDIDETVYFKHESGQLMVSPADETNSPPCDAQPEELDVAIAIDRYQRLIDHGSATPSHTWAGLRTFAPDRTFVVGPDPRADGFYWLAGQGGYGVQSAPALARLATQLVLGKPTSEAVKPVLNRILPDRLL
jgi:D-arginine dehydrogenase